MEEKTGYIASHKTIHMFHTKPNYKLHKYWWWDPIDSKEGEYCWENVSTKLEHPTTQSYVYTNVSITPTKSCLYTNVSITPSIRISPY